MKIAYDFDGIFYKDESTLDGIGETFKKDNKLKGFYFILDKIRNQIKNHNEIYIISRAKKEDIIDYLKQLFIFPLIDINNIITDLGENISKIMIIEQKGINRFYVDSVHNIHEINLKRKDILKNNSNNSLKTLELFLMYPEGDEIRKIKTGNLKMLTYNLNWYNMIANDKAPIKECKEKDLCTTNINNLIQNQLPLDFIFLQEVLNEEILLKNLKKDFQIIRTLADKEIMFMLINNKYEVESSIGGEFEPGRPFLIAFIKNYNFCLISVHRGHTENKLKIDLKTIEDTIYKFKNQKEMKSYRIIIGGDFNEDVGNNIEFCGKILKTRLKRFTCCVYSTHINKKISRLKYLKGKNVLNIDHILDSLYEPVYITTITPLDENNNLIPGSDHLGLYGELKLN